MAAVIFLPCFEATYTYGTLKIYNNGTAKTDIPKRISFLDARAFSDIKTKIAYSKFWVPWPSESQVLYTGNHLQGAVQRSSYRPDADYTKRFGQPITGSTGAEAIIYLRTFHDSEKAGRTDFLDYNDPITALFEQTESTEICSD